jgi:hypothetical protein
MKASLKAAFASLLTRSDPVAFESMGGSYVEFRIMVSQGLRGADGGALTLFGGRGLSIITGSPGTP